MGICWGLYKLLLADKNSFLFNRGFLLCSIIGLSIVPLITLPSFASRAVEPMLPPLESVIPSYEYLSAQSSDIGKLVIEPSETLILFDWSWIFYCIALMILVRILFNIAKLSWSSYKDYLHLQDGVRIIKSNYKNTPFSFFNNLFVSPRDIELGLPDEIWEHEICHIRHHHSLDRIFVELVLIVQWWNPFAHFLIKDLKENHEYTADSYAIKSKKQSKTLIDQLLRHRSKKSSSQLFQIGFAQSSIFNRIRMIHASNRELSPSTIVFVLGLLMCIIYSCSDTTDHEFYDYEVVELSIIEDSHTKIRYQYPASLVNRVHDPHMLTGYPEYKSPSKELFQKFKTDGNFDIYLDERQLKNEDRKALTYNTIKAFRVYDVAHLNKGVDFKAELLSKKGYFESMEKWIANLTNLRENMERMARKHNEDLLEMSFAKYHYNGGAPASEIPKRKIISNDQFEEFKDPSKYSVKINYEMISNSDLMKRSPDEFSYYIIDKVTVGRGPVRVNLFTHDEFAMRIDRMKNGLPKEYKSILEKIKQREN